MASKAVLLRGFLLTRSLQLLPYRCEPQQSRPSLADARKMPTRLRPAAIFSREDVGVGTGAKAALLHELIDGGADAGFAVGLVVNRRMESRFGEEPRRGKFPRFGKLL